MDLIHKSGPNRMIEIFAETLGEVTKKSMDRDRRGIVSFKFIVGHRSFP